MKAGIRGKLGYGIIVELGGVHGRCTYLKKIKGGQTLKMKGGGDPRR